MSTTIPETMHAVVIKHYGSADVLQYVEYFPVPKIKDNEILVNMKFASVNAIDAKYRAGHMSKFVSLTFPCVLGRDGSGVVVQVGKNVSKFKDGDEVLGKIQKIGGTYAQFAVFKEHELVLKPPNLSFEIAACIPVVGLTIYQAMKKMPIIQKPNSKILIYGGSGGTGTLAVQLAKYYGSFVYATCSTKNIEYVKNLGADRIIDYTRENVDDVLMKEGKVDCILDTVGGMQNMRQAARVLNKHGHYMTIAPPKYGGYRYTRFFGYMAWRKLLSTFGRPKFDFIRNHVNQKDLQAITDLYAQEKVKVFITKEFCLKNVQEAHKLVRLKFY